MRSLQVAMRALCQRLTASEFGGFGTMYRC
jgi:hypothetical protein